MGAETGLGRRAGTVARWPVGMGLAFWRYPWRTMPLHRTDEDGSPDQDLPRRCPTTSSTGGCCGWRTGPCHCSGAATGSASRAPGAPPRR
jgi:hypothetical protein